MEKQKSYYKSLFLTIIGLSLWIGGFINAIICGILFKNFIILVPINILLSLVGLIIYIMDDNWSSLLSKSHPFPTFFYKYHYYGVPNNNYKEFEVKSKDILQEDNITIIEVEKGIFETTINGKKIILNLRGWHNKGYCLYEYFMSVLQSELSKYSYKKAKKTIYIKDKINLTLLIIFKNNKTKKYILVKNNKTKITTKFKLRLAIKCDCLRIFKVCVKELYDFNI